MMPYLLSFGALAMAWTLLNLLSREREVRLREIHHRARQAAAREQARRQRESEPPVVR